MFNHYLSLDQIIRDDHTEQIKQELNSYPLYTFMVRRFGFKEIGIVALDDTRKEIGKYASHNNEQGEITEIVDHFVKPDIAVKAKERDLLEILHRAEWVKAHPLAAILQYCWRFSLVTGQYQRVGEDVGDFLAKAFSERS